MAPASDSSTVYFRSPLQVVCQPIRLALSAWNLAGYSVKPDFTFCRLLLIWETFPNFPDRRH
jgi:hypothetical protein